MAGGLTRSATCDHLSSAAGLAPVPEQSGKVHYLRRGDKSLRRIFYQSAFCALQHDPASRAFTTAKRAEGKRDHPALTTLDHPDRPVINGDDLVGGSILDPTTGRRSPAGG